MEFGASESGLLPPPKKKKNSGCGAATGCTQSPDGTLTFYSPVSETSGEIGPLGDFGAFCLDVRTLTFCQPMGFLYETTKNDNF